MQKTDMTVARTIAAQMGGTRRLSLMVGADNFIGSADSLTFAFKGSAKANRCKITLDPSDTYTVQILKIGRAPEFKCKTVFEGSDFYCDDLQLLFETKTGLYLSL
jgi:hypothetical protein